MKFKLILLFSVSVCFAGNAAGIRFKQSIGGNSPESGYCARQTYDKGYIAVGTSSSFTNGQSDIYVVKTDSNGQVMWTKNFGSANVEVARYVEETKDSALIIVGYTNNTNGKGYDVYLLRLDRWGNKVWEKTYGGADWEFAYSVHQTNDGGFIIAGSTYSYGMGNEDMYLIKTDINGDTAWTKTYGGIDDDEARSVRQTSDGGYIVVGSTKSFVDSTGDAYVVKTNSTGGTLWTKSYGGNKADRVNDVIECMNGDYALCGITGSYSNKDLDFFLFRVNNTNTLLWAKNFGKDSLYDALESLVELKNGRLASIGASYGYTGGGKDDGYLLLTDANGNFIDGATYGTGGHEQCFSVQVTRDNGFIICGYTDSTKIGFNANNLLLIKTDSTGRLPIMKFWYSTNDINTSLINSIFAYPNPFNAELHIVITTHAEIDVSDFTLILTDITGRICTADYSIIKSQNKSLELLLRKSNLDEGIYFIQYLLKQQPSGVSKVIVN